MKPDNAFDALCERIDRLVAKWRPYTSGKVKVEVCVVATDTRKELVPMRVLTKDEIKALAYIEMEPLVEEALAIKRSLS